MYKIGLFSQITKTTIKALRYYDEIGLLKPSKVDEENNYRYYTTEQMYILHKILHLKQMGFSISEISQILGSNNIKEILDKRIVDLKKEIEYLLDQLSRVNHFFYENVKGGFFMNYQAVVKQTFECIVYYKRLSVANYVEYFDVIPQIGQEVTKINPELKCAVPEYCFIQYLDEEYKDHNFNIEYCEAVTEYGKETETIKFKKLPSILVVSTLHKGSYNDLRNAYNYLFSWISENNYECVDNAREVYIDGIWNKENEKEWLTELQIPIRKI